MTEPAGAVPRCRRCGEPTRRGQVGSVRYCVRCAGIVYREKSVTARRRSGARPVAEWQAMLRAYRAGLAAPEASETGERGDDEDRRGG